MLSFGFAGDMAEEMKLPRVPLWTAGPRSLLVHAATDSIRQRVLGTDGNREKTLEFLPGFSKLEVADLPDGVVSGNLESPISSLIHKMGQKLPKATTRENSFRGKINLSPKVENSSPEKIRDETVLWLKSSPNGHP
ncbi:flavonol 3-O-glucosyltransferase F3GT2-like [Rosa chinensis]|uniref:flavonol 3-O-glucosyltransferase F3GT2-like n=1 Tax=Rosa chinensis TaxID=74649 RepID=UPI001AD8E596|nr:flavonol 3-O-glucosyltransferase F3GT2-like [Rosa chinensis]